MSEHVRGKKDPAAFKHNIPSIIRLFLAGIVICILTLFVVDSALLYEMSGIFKVRPVHVFSLILATSLMLVFAILLYPILMLHYRRRILLEEEVKRLNMKYHDGLQEFQRRRKEDLKLEGEHNSISPKAVLNKWKGIAEDMSQDYSDFAYLHITLLDRLWQRKQEIDMEIKQGDRAFEQIKKGVIRQLIHDTAEERIEDTAYDFNSYEMPVSFCMLAVAFGFIVSSLVPFLGTGKIQFGTVPINLVWAAGGFIGAYLYSLYPFFQRYTRRDLPPRAFLHYGLKVFLGIIVVTIFGNLFLEGVPEGYQFSLAAILGSVPFLLMSRSREFAFKKLGWDSSGTGIGNQDVTIITGITREYAERLHEEGVMNIQNLAFVDIEILSNRTMFNRNMLFEWKDEAILRLLTRNVPNFFDEEEKESEGGEKKEERGETLYDALAKVGVNNVTTLATRLECRRSTAEERKKGGANYIVDPKSEVMRYLVKLLGWQDKKEEYKYLLSKICIQGKTMLGEVSGSSITTFVFDYEE